jgi:hypothetical protein
MDPTAAAYQGLPNVDKALYDRIRDSPRRKLTHVHTVPIRSGYAWKVANTLMRLSGYRYLLVAYAVFALWTARRLEI